MVRSILLAVAIALVACIAVLPEPPRRAEAAGSFYLPFSTGTYKVTTYYSSGSYPACLKANPACHPAYDLVPSGTTDILAAGGGAAAGVDGTSNVSDCWGRYVLIHHTDGHETIYAHLSSIDPALGSLFGTRGDAEASLNSGHGVALAAGQKIGVMGHAGCASGDHLHFEVQTSSGQPVDPGSPDNTYSGCTQGSALWANCPAQPPPPPKRPPDHDGDGIPDSKDSGDFNGDGYSDLVHSADPGNVYFWPGSPTGPHQGPVISTPGYANQLGTWYVGDFNGDGYTDLVHSADPGHVYFWPGSPTGPHQGPLISTPGYANQLGTWYVGDFNGDGYTDLVHSADPGHVYFWPGSPTGPHQGPLISTPGYANQLGTWYVGDFNGDGYTDLVHSADPGNMYFWPGSPTGPHQGPVISTPGYANQLGTWYVGDFNGDGYSDLVHSADPGHVYFWPGSATGPHQGPVISTPGYGNQLGTWFGGYVGSQCTSTTDSECDGLPNAYENAHSCLGSRVFDSYMDPDADGLINAQEMALGSDPCNAYSSGDGYTDGQHVALGKNPNTYCKIMRADVDGDGVVSILDLAKVAQYFTQSVPPAPARYDQDGDARISILDLANMASVFTQPVSACP